ncbi:hypothetical protein M3C58_03720 [Brachybacterium muris]|uniref:hypothetical protein n=1 Tax=Brachybacterium muris TaxID=219301 RepID=UPI0021A60E38|nr:hypothetical protein [Brachybacterium muris]MCT1997318.1 hypothetical protein [Brachybacterium muris]
MTPNDDREVDSDRATDGHWEADDDRKIDHDTPADDDAPTDDDTHWRSHFVEADAPATVPEPGGFTTWTKVKVGFAFGMIFLFAAAGAYVLIDEYRPYGGQTDTFRKLVVAELCIVVGTVIALIMWIRQNRSRCRP